MCIFSIYFRCCDNIFYFQVVKLQNFIQNLHIEIQTFIPYSKKSYQHLSQKPYKQPLSNKMPEFLPAFTFANLSKFNTFTLLFLLANEHFFKFFHPFSCFHRQHLYPRRSNCRIRIYIINRHPRAHIP